MITDPFEYLDRLSVLPLFKVSEFLNPYSLFLGCLKSKRWEEFVKRGGKIKGSAYRITITKDSVLFQFKFNNKAHNFQIVFKNDPSLTEDANLSYDNRCLITYLFNTTSHFESSCLITLQLLSHLFPPTYDRINVSLGDSSTEFPLRLLSLLPQGTANFVDLQADFEVDGGNLVNFLRNVHVENSGREDWEHRLDVSLRIKNLVQSDESLIRNSHFKISDARFLTRESFAKLDFVSGEFGDNNFTSADFNSFFRSWKAGEKTKRLAKAIFDIREDQKIEMEEVMKGLKPYVHTGGYRNRNRYRLDYPSGVNGHLNLTAIDMNHGWDVTNSEGILGSVLLVPNRLIFVTWPHRFQWATYEDLLEHTREFYTWRIGIMRKRQRDLEEKMPELGDSEYPRMQEQLMKCHEDIRNREQFLQKCDDIEGGLFVLARPELPMHWYYSQEKLRRMDDFLVGKNISFNRES